MITINQLQLTPEQIELIPIYRSKWQQVAINKEAIDREQATIAINNAYNFLNLSQPNIIFLSTPYDAIQYINREIDNSWGNLENSVLGVPQSIKVLEQLLGKIKTEIKPEITEQLQGKLDEGIGKAIAAKTFIKLEIPPIFSLMFAHSKRLMEKDLEESTQFYGVSKIISELLLDSFFKLSFIQNKFFVPISWQAYNQFVNIFIPEQSQNINDTWGAMGGMIFAGEFQDQRNLKYQLPSIEIGAAVGNVIVPSVLADFAYYIDYLHKVLGCDRDEIKWNIFQDLIISCGWIFPYEKTVFICDHFSSN